MEVTFKWIAASNRYYLMYLNRMLAPHGINASQSLFLLHVCRHPGIAQDALPSLFQINKSNVTRALAQLEEHDFIRRERHPSDKRTAVIFPTQKALEVYPIIMYFVKEWDSTVMDILSPEQRIQFHTMLQQLMEKAKSTVEAQH